MNKIRVVLADDHPLVLKGIRDFLLAAGDIEVLQACRDGAEALAAVRRLRPHVAVLDVSMPRMGGLDVLAAIEEQGLPTSVLFLAGAPSAQEVMSAMAGGAYGFLAKDCQPDALLIAVRSAAAGRRTYPFDLAAAAPERERASAPQDLLTPAEWKVMACAVQGMTNKEIARRLSITAGTTKIHLHHVFRKLGIKNRTTLAALALRQTKEGDRP